MKINNYLRELGRYSQVKLIVTVVSLIWTVFFVDFLNWSGLSSSLLYIPVVGGGTFILHKLRGAKF